MLYCTVESAQTFSLEGRITQTGPDAFLWCHQPILSLFPVSWFCLKCWLKLQNTYCLSSGRMFMVLWLSSDNSFNGAWCCVKKKKSLVSTFLVFQIVTDELRPRNLSVSALNECLGGQFAWEILIFKLKKPKKKIRTKHMDSNLYHQYNTAFSANTFWSALCPRLGDSPSKVWQLCGSQTGLTE